MFFLKFYFILFLKNVCVKFENQAKISNVEIIKNLLNHFQMISEVIKMVWDWEGGKNQTLLEWRIRNIPKSNKPRNQWWRNIRHAEKWSGPGCSWFYKHNEGKIYLATFLSSAQMQTLKKWCSCGSHEGVLQGQHIGIKTLEVDQ